MSEKITLPNGMEVIRINMNYHRNGNIKFVRYEKKRWVDTTIGKIKSDTISFYSDGKLQDVSFPFNAKLINTPSGKLKANFVRFFRTGKVERARIIESIDVGDRHIFENDVVYWNRKGKLIRIRSES